MPNKPYDTPVSAVAEHGVVLLDGPDGLAISLTPRAARASADNLLTAARIAEDMPDAETP